MSQNSNGKEPPLQKRKYAETGVKEKELFHVTCKMGVYEHAKKSKAKYRTENIHIIAESADDLTEKIFAVCSQHIKGCVEKTCENDAVRWKVCKDKEVNFLNCGNFIEFKDNISKRKNSLNQITDRVWSRLSTRTEDSLEVKIYEYGPDIDAEGLSQILENSNNINEKVETKLDKIQSILKAKYAKKWIPTHECSWELWAREIVKQNIQMQQHILNESFAPPMELLPYFRSMDYTMTPSDEELQGLLRLKNDMAQFRELVLKMLERMDQNIDSELEKIRMRVEENSR